MGKGSKRRIENFKKVQENWDEINWNNNKNMNKHRSFKFRAWNPVSKKFIYSDKRDLETELFRLHDFFNECYKVGDYDIYFQQFIGDKDFNRHDIYEGDIIEWNYDDGDRVSIWVKKRGVVEWDSDWCRFIVKTKDNTYSVGTMIFSGYKIIGNTFETPELLK